MFVKIVAKCTKKGGYTMSDEKRIEELKAQINEKLDMLSIEELEEVAGGYNGRVFCCDYINSEGQQCFCSFSNMLDLVRHEKSGNHKFLKNF